MQYNPYAVKTTDHPQYITQLNAFHRWLETHFLPANAKLLWFMLIGLFNASGWEEWVQFDNRHLMQMVNAQTEKTALRARQKLIEAGLLVYEKGKKAQPGRYRLVWFTEKDSENDSKNDRESVRNATEETTGTYTSYIRKEKEKDERKTEYAGVPAPLSDVFGAYAEMRKKMRKPLTQSAVRLVLQTLESLAPDKPDLQRQILEQSLLNGWAGVFPLKQEEAPEPPASYDIGEFERKLLYGKIEYKKPVRFQERRADDTARSVPLA